MSVLKVISCCWMVYSVLHLALFYCFPYSEPHYLWELFAESGIYLNIALAMLFIWITFDGLEMPFTCHNCPVIVIAHLIAVLYIWAAIGMCCVLYFVSEISASAFSVFWITSLVFAALALALLINSITLGASVLLASSSSCKSHQLYYTFLTILSIAVTGLILFQSDSLEPQLSLFTRWSFIVSSLFLLFLALLCKQESSLFSLQVGFFRLKHIFLSLTHFVTLEGCILFAFLLSSHPYFFQIYSYLSILFLLQLSLSAPLFVLTSLYSVTLDSFSPFLLGSPQFLLLEFHNYGSESFIPEFCYSFLFLLSHFSGFTELYESESLQAWITFPAVVPLLYSVFNFSMRRLIFKNIQFSLQSLQKLNKHHACFSAGVLVVWLIWALLWALLGHSSYEVTLALILAVLFSLLVKTFYWHLRFHKLILQQAGDPQNDSIADLLDVHEEAEQALSPKSSSFSPYLTRQNTTATNQQECAICLGVLGSEVSRLNECGHQFHDECIKHWLRMKMTCPVDRKLLT